MKLKPQKRNDKENPRQSKREESMRTKENKVVITKRERGIFQIPGFPQFNALMKLRIVVSVIFFLCTISIIILIFALDYNWISIIMLLIGYLLLFILMIKLFIIKRL